MAELSEQELQSEAEVATKPAECKEGATVFRASNCIEHEEGICRDCPFPEKR